MSAPSRHPGLRARKQAGEQGRVSGTMLVLALLCAAIVAWGVSSRSGDSDDWDEQPDLTNLVASSTKSTLNDAPRDPAPRAATDGAIVRPKQATGVYDAPQGSVFGKIGRKQFGPTWLPVIAEEDGWVQVLLPSRPNGSTGWIPADRVQRQVSPYLIRVHVGSRTLELFFEGKRTGSWPVAVGKAETPTPTGRTFVLGSIADSSQSSQVILPLGAHSQTLDSYGGGPGTVALHAWPDASVFGTAASHGCVRVPDDALDELTKVPLGTVVLIDRK